ncbi:dihydrolipoamide acetyltransferase component of pyruvate dehydrogenase complex [Pseudoclavibacter endophyticus]|uniref:Dihydrolipoamide acetyltransferase component of pyruvate dehydrogenase complex n=1 Tax=Pseudoclavibacter endophyticus TaxID=1778590 RepID=A0A6H9WD29_9MICO|nr:dihydrolipoamide acetyltransferase family protein [Pseudoclavibacter endophyticus]KAB1648862.1 2-oxo acid dehydrogenase subunit E2 [Pseudoclavibacter endophyticus]GGA67753.1 dihydrolipoamide acetyltransferase component of pyruvate dehydrogenase complex [Pseudoclavibacter endophyticus]
MSTTNFELPDVGEGLTEAEIVQWHVRPGDRIELNQTLVEIETAKSLVELPSPFEGTVSEVLVSEGTTVDVGSVILTVSIAADGRGADAGEQVSAAEADREFEEARADTASTIQHEGESSGSVLVGYGLGDAPSSRRGRRGARRAPGQGPAGADGAAQNAGAQAAKSALAEQAAATATEPASAGPKRLTSVPAASATPIIAKPPIRKLARDLEVDLQTVEPTGLVGEITRDDVIRHAQQASLFKNLETPAWGDVREERHAVKGVRKAIANAMSTSMFTAPHVTLFVDVDATRTMEFVKRLKTSPDFAGVKVSPLLIVAKAVMWAIRRNPTTNAAWTDEEYTVKHFVNLGIAAATPRGLIVPNIKDAHGMSLHQLAQAIEQLTLRARDGKTPPAEQQGGTFTITNIGVFGMDSGTPILNPGEVGILALGTIKPKPWVVDDEVQVRRVTTLTASFDHRLVDGDVASRFLADVATIIEEPALLLD